MSAPSTPVNVGGVPFNTTTNAGFQSAATFPTVANQVYQVYAYFTAQNSTTHAAGLNYVRRAAFLNNGGTLTQIGATAVVGTDLESAALAAADATLSANGTNIVASVAGVAATNMSWLVDMQVTQSGTFLANSGVI